MFCASFRSSRPFFFIKLDYFSFLFIFQRMNIFINIILFHAIYSNLLFLCNIAEGRSMTCGPQRAWRRAWARRALRRAPLSSPTSNPSPSPCPPSTDRSPRLAPLRHLPQAPNSTEPLRAWYPKCYFNCILSPYTLFFNNKSLLVKVIRV